MACAALIGPTPRRSVSPGTGRLRVDAGAAGGREVIGTWQSEGHVGPGPQRVQDPVTPGVRLAAVEDPVIVQAEQVPGLKHEPRGRQGSLLGEPRPGGEVLTVVRPRCGTVGEALVWMTAHGEAPTAGPRGHRSPAEDRLAGSGRADPSGIYPVPG